MRGTKIGVSFLLLLSLIATVCLSACEENKPYDVQINSTEADEDHTLPDEQSTMYDPKSELDVLNHYSNMFIASKVDSSLNVRETPSTKGTIIGKITKNGGGEILDDLGEWFFIQSGGIVGYVASKYCITGKEAYELAPSVAVKKACVTTQSLNVRRGPGNGYEVLTQLGIGDYVPLVGEQGQWYKIRLSDHMEGYISKEYAKTGWYLTGAEPLVSVKRQKLLRYAEQFIGIPYKLGGTSLDKGGIDCSNFVHECLKNALGIGLDRTSRQLATRGYTVSLSDVKPGDLMFYADESGKINHVAFYMGDGKIIHASQTFGKVSISAYNYKSEPVLIKNVIGD